MFQGSITAIVTPMLNTGEIDENSFRALLEWQISEGSDGIVINGTTGESPTLTSDERYRLMQVSKDVIKGRVPLIMGTGSYSTAETIKRTQEAYSLGVDACLIVTPYFNKPTQEGLYQHFAAIAKTTNIPIILYNVSSRTVCDLLPETVARLSLIENIKGIKEASSDLNRVRELSQLCSTSFDLLSGDDASALAFMLHGGKGVISVTANVAPKLMHEMCKSALKGALQSAGQLNTRLMPLHKSLFVESNPIPVKWALEQMGKIKGGIRLPLLPLSQEKHAIVRQAMIDSGLLES